MNKEKFLGFNPCIELFIRKLYYSDSVFLKAVFSAIKKKKTQNKQTEFIPNFNNNKNLQKIIGDLGIKPGDLLIVHSSSEELLKIGISPIKLLNFLENLIGEQGTLVIPCFPLYNSKNFDSNQNAYIYSTKKTLCSTGMLPNLFLREKNVERSPFPWNSLAAKGVLAKQMIEKNLETDLAHGKGSAWEFCMNHNAKILLLGVHASHTTTMVHVAEDMLDNKWPIIDWYERRFFLLKEENIEKKICIRVRKQDWAKYNASWYRSYMLKKQKLLMETDLNGMYIGFINDSKKMVNYIIDKSLSGKPFFIVPKRFIKNEE